MKSIAAHNAKTTAREVGGGESTTVPLDNCPSLMLFECAHCGHLVTREPVRDDLEVRHVGTEHARAWCSLECRESDAEAYWLGRWSWGPTSTRRRTCTTTRTNPCATPAAATASSASTPDAPDSKHSRAPTASCGGSQNDGPAP